MKLINCLIFAVVIISLILYSQIFKNSIKKYKIANRFFVLGILVLTVFMVYAINYINMKPLFLDTVIYEFISKTISTQATKIFLEISEFGLQNIITIFLMLAISYIVIYKKNNLYWQMLIINFCLGVFVNQSLKPIFARPRPEILRLENVGGYSFPSGHATISMCFYGYIIYLILTLLKTKFKYLFASLFTILVALVGYSRVYLGSHYTSDVIGGFLCGLGILLISCAITNYLYKNNKELKFNSLILILGIFTSMQNSHTIKLYFKVLAIAIVIQIVLYFIFKMIVKMKKIAEMIEKYKKKKVPLLVFIPGIRLLRPYIKQENVTLIDFLKYNLTGSFIFVLAYLFAAGKLNYDFKIYFSYNILSLIFILSIPLFIYYFRVIRKQKINE